MDWRDKLKQILIGKTIKDVRLSDSHGGVFKLWLGDSVALYVWAFGEPDDLQVVVYDESEYKILLDLRGPECISYTEKVKADMVSRFPHIDGPDGSDPFPPFKTYHKAD